MIAFFCRLRHRLRRRPVPGTGLAVAPAREARVPAPVQTHDLRLQGIEPQTGALLLPGGVQRYLVRVAAGAYADDPDTAGILAGLAAAFNGLRSAVSLLVWSEPSGLAAPIAALEARLAEGRLAAEGVGTAQETNGTRPRLTGARRALAQSHLDTLRALASRRIPQQPAPRHFEYFLTVDQADPAVARRDADDLAAAFGGTVLSARAAEAALAQGWRAKPLLAPGGKYLGGQVWLATVDGRGEDAGPVVHFGPNGTHLEPSAN